MAAFDQLREEFDRLSREEQLGLSIQGLFSTYRQGGQQGSGGLFSKDTTVEADLSKRSTNQMSSFMASQTYRVRISNVLGDIVDPLGDLFDGTATRNRIHQNSLHHESTLYQQGIIDAIKEQGQENRTGFVRSTMLGYERFKRDPLWSSLNVLGKVLTTTLKTSWAILFGRDKRTVEQKMLDEMKKHTEYFKTGSISSDGVFERLGRKGILGFSADVAMTGAKELYKTLTGEQQKQKEDEKTNSYLDTLVTINRFILKSTASEIRESRDAVISTMTAANDEFIEQQMVANGSNVTSINSMTSTVDQQRMEESSRNNRRETHYEQQKSAYEEFLETQRDTRSELEEHNRREKRRSIFGAIGKLLGGGGALTAVIGGALASMNDTVRGALWKGFEYVASNMWDLLNESLSTSQKAGLVGGAILLSPLRGIVFSMGKQLIRAISSTAFRTTIVRALGSALGPVLSGISALLYSSKTAGDDKAGFGGYSEDTTFTPTTMNRMVPIYNEISRLKKERDLAREERKGYERSERLIEVNKKLAEAEQRLIDVRKQSQKDWNKRNTREKVSPIALYSANAVASSMGNSGQMDVPERSPSGRYGGLLKLIRQTETGDNYNALVYGKKGRKVPGSTNLTDMSIEEVMDYQKGMLSSGHASTAVGGYQIIKDTLANAVKKTEGVDKSSLFDRKTQDQLARTLIDSRRRGTSTSGEFADNLSKEWASLPHNTGRSYYDGVNQNRSSIDRQSFMRQVSNADEFQRVGRRLDDAGKAIADGAGSAKKKILDVFSGGNMGSGGLLDKALEAVGISTAEANTEKPAIITNESMQAMAKVMEDSSMKGFSRAMEAFEQSGGTVQISGDLDD